MIFVCNSSCVLICTAACMLGCGIVGMVVMMVAYGVIEEKLVFDVVGFVGKMVMDMVECFQMVVFDGMVS